MNEQFFSLVRDIAIIFPTFLLVFTFRGFFKSLMATIMGDDTSFHAGFLTLNPLAHVDIYGVLAVLMVLFFIGGLIPGIFPRSMLFILVIIMGVRWTYFVPIDERNFTHRTWGTVLTLLAGSFGTMILALLGMYIHKYLPFNAMPGNISMALVQILAAILQLSLFFSVLDLVPLPPFDGGRLLVFLAPASWQPAMNILEEYSLYILIALFVIPGISDVFFSFLHSTTVLLGRFLSFLVI